MTTNTRIEHVSSPLLNASHGRALHRTIAPSQCKRTMRVLPLQEQSFKEFAQRPENKALLEEHQQQEISAALQLQEQMQELHLQQQVS